MKQTRLLEIIREEIAGALNEVGQSPEEKKATDLSIAAKKAQIVAAQKALAQLSKTGVTESEELEEDNLNEVPDFGGKLDQGVAKEFGEKNTLQNAVDKIVGETLTDMGVTLEDLKKDKAKATEALTSIREKVLGAKRKNIPQDPRVTKALEKQEDVEVATLGAISGKSLQQNQTENAIKKALGLVTPGKQGRPAGEPKAEKPASTGKKGRPAGKPKAEKVATRTPGDDGFDDVSYSDAGVDDEGNKIEIDTKIQTPTGDIDIESRLNSVISAKKTKLKAAKKGSPEFEKELAALTSFLQGSEISKYVKKKIVGGSNPYSISNILKDIE